MTGTRLDLLLHPVVNLAAVGALGLLLLELVLFLGAGEITYIYAGF